MELTLGLHKIQIPNLLVIAVTLLPPACMWVCVRAPRHTCMCMCVLCQGPHKDFEYNLVWSAALEAIFCSFSTAVLEIADQGVLAAM